MKIEVSKKPTISIFERFKSNFHRITHSDTAELDYPSIEGYELLHEKKSSIKSLCNDLLQQSFVRGDYKELVKLVVLYLSDDLGEDFSSFNQPGACHQARFWRRRFLRSFLRLQYLPEVNSRSCRNL